MATILLKYPVFLLYDTHALKRSCAPLFCTF